MKDFFYYYYRALKYAMRYKFLYFTSLTALLLFLFFNNFTVFVLKDLINTINSGSDFLFPLLYIAGLLAIPIILEPLNFFPRSLLHTRIVKDVMTELYTKIMSMDYEYHTKKETGKLISKVINSDWIPRVYFWNIEYWLFESLAAFVIPIVLISFISKEVAIIISLFVIISLPFFMKLLKINVDKRVVMKNDEYARNSAFVDGIGNYETVRLFAKKDQEINYIKKLLDRVFVSMQDYQNSFRIIDFMTRLIGVFMFSLSVGYIYLNRSNFDIGSIVVIITYSIQISNSLVGFVFKLRDMFKDIPLIADVFEILDTDKKVSEPGNPISIENPQGLVKFKDVSFCYQGDHTVLKEINFSINPGETVAFVGPSGGGKTTIARLIMRYYDPTKGVVSIDDISLADMGTENVNKIIGAVPQEPVLFNRSILYNIGYALSTDEEELKNRLDEVYEAAIKAQIHNFILTLPDGYNTMVGERGIKLSGGQKQRIAIARVLLKNPKVVIFDEATSMLDSESESAIQKAFRELSKDTTTVVIAHRLSTIKNVDKIYVVDKGTIVEEGRHEDLIKMPNGIYNHLWNLQSSGFSKG